MRIYYNLFRIIIIIGLFFTNIIPFKNISLAQTENILSLSIEVTNELTSIRYNLPVVVDIDWEYYINNGSLSSEDDVTLYDELNQVVDCTPDATGILAFRIDEIGASSTRIFTLVFNDNTATNFPMIAGSPTFEGLYCDGGYFSDGGGLAAATWISEYPNPSRFNIIIDGYFDNDDTDKESILENCMTGEGRIDNTLISMASNLDITIEIPTFSVDHQLILSPTYSSLEDDSDATYYSYTTDTTLWFTFSDFEFSSQFDELAFYLVDRCRSSTGIGSSELLIKIDGLTESLSNSYINTFFTNLSSIVSDRPGGGNFVYTDFTTTTVEVGVRIVPGTGATIDVAELDLYAIVSKSGSPNDLEYTFSTTDISDPHNIEIDSNDDSFNIYYDGVLEVTDFPIPLDMYCMNASDYNEYIIGYNGGVLQLNEYYMEFNNDLDLSEHYEMNSGAYSSGILEDTSGNEFYGLIYYGASIDCNINITENTGSGTDIEPDPYAPVIGDPNVPVEGVINPLPYLPSWYGGCTNIEDLPFYQTFSDRATETGMDACFLYFMVMMATVSALGLGVLLFTGSTILTIGIMLFGLGATVGTTVSPGFLVFTFIILALAIYYLAKQR